MARFRITLSQPDKPAGYLTVEAPTSDVAYDRIQKRIDDGTLVVSASGDLRLDPAHTEISDIVELEHVADRFKHED